MSFFFQMEISTENFRGTLQCIGSVPRNATFLHRESEMEKERQVMHTAIVRKSPHLTSSRYRNLTV
jgi:hypothetical protein